MPKKPTSLPILLADDISDEPSQKRRSRSLRKYGATLAERLGSAVELVYVEGSPLLAKGTSKFYPLLERHAESQQSRLNHAAGSISPSCRARYLEGDPAATLVALANGRPGYEAIVLGTHGHTGISRILAGSIAEEVIRRSRIPVMVVGPRAWEGAKGFLAGRTLTLLVPTLLNSSTRSAERYAISLARRLGCSITYVHCIRETMHPVLQSAFSTPYGARRLRTELEELKTASARRMATLIARTRRLGVEAHAILDDQSVSAAQAVLSAAEEKVPALIVMGTHGRSLVGGAFFGRTARSVILGSDAPVITVSSMRRGRA